MEFAYANPNEIKALRRVMGIGVAIGTSGTTIFAIGAFVCLLRHDLLVGGIFGSGSAAAAVITSVTFKVWRALKRKEEPKLVSL